MFQLEQWRSRFHVGQRLPSISEDEAAEIVHSELGQELSQGGDRRLISKSRITDLTQRTAVYAHSRQMFVLGHSRSCRQARKTNEG